MIHPETPIIAGAGPVGLGAALFLAREGIAARVVEEREEPSRASRALAVNPRTLEILEPTGLTRRILELGSPIRGVRFHRRGRVIATLSFAGIHPNYPFMVALSQAGTERLLERALAAAGGAVERGVRMAGCRNLDGGVEVALEPSAGGPREVAAAPWLLAADGAHSVARRQLGIDFPGSSAAREWHLADVPLRTDLAADYAHVFFLGRDGFLFLIRVVDEALDGTTAAPVWRVMGNRPDPLSRLVRAEPAGPPLWASRFRVAHRVDAALAAGHVYFAGDAAHVHSPVGARGMNLGLEDAWVFARLARAGRLDRYDALRRPVDRGVVGRVRLITRVASGESPLTRFVRALVLPVMITVPFTRGLMLETVTGLDHPLPADLTGDAGDRSAAASDRFGGSRRMLAG
jgi:2-polyprenyl-6-methoxyphenol hydroxylase-like FAD-dependent oxidoreductase